MHSTPLEFEALKTRLKSTWMAGDFGQIAKYSEPAAEEFIARRTISPGLRVLDVACGTGNLAIPAARAGAIVTGVDIAPNLLEQGRLWAQRENVQVQFDEGDAEHLQYPDATFDLVVSQFGAMFAPRPALVAAELVRVCRPGGEIAMANWTPQGFIGQLFKLMGSYVPPPPDMPTPLLWGEENTVRERLRDGIGRIQVNPVMPSLHYPYSVPETVEFYRYYFGPAQRAFATLTEDKQQHLRDDLERLWAQYNLATDGSTLVEAEYLEIIAVRS